MDSRRRSSFDTRTQAGLLSQGPRYTMPKSTRLKWPRSKSQSRHAAPLSNVRRSDHESIHQASRPRLYDPYVGNSGVIKRRRSRSIASERRVHFEDGNGGLHNHGPGHRNRSSPLDPLLSSAAASHAWQHGRRNSPGFDTARQSYYMAGSPFGHDGRGMHAYAAPGADTYFSMQPHYPPYAYSVHDPYHAARNYNYRDEYFPSGHVDQTPVRRASQWRYGPEPAYFPPHIYPSGKPHQNPHFPHYQTPLEDDLHSRRYDNSINRCQPVGQHEFKDLAIQQALEAPAETASINRPRNRTVPDNPSHSKSQFADSGECGAGIPGDSPVSSSLDLFPKRQSATKACASKLGETKSSGPKHNALSKQMLPYSGNNYNSGPAERSNLVRNSNERTSGRRNRRSDVSRSSPQNHHARGARELKAIQEKAILCQPEDDSRASIASIINKKRGTEARSPSRERAFKHQKFEQNERSHTISNNKTFESTNVDIARRSSSPSPHAYQQHACSSLSQLLPSSDLSTTPTLNDSIPNREPTEASHYTTKGKEKDESVAAKSDSKDGLPVRLNHISAEETHDHNENHASQLCFNPGSIAEGVNEDNFQDFLMNDEVKPAATLQNYKCANSDALSPFIYKEGSQDALNQDEYQSVPATNVQMGVGDQIITDETSNFLKMKMWPEVYESSRMSSSSLDLGQTDSSSNSVICLDDVPSNYKNDTQSLTQQPQEKARNESPTAREPRNNNLFVSDIGSEGTNSVLVESVSGKTGVQAKDTTLLSLDEPKVVFEWPCSNKHPSYLRRQQKPSVQSKVLNEAEKLTPPPIQASDIRAATDQQTLTSRSNPLDETEKREPYTPPAPNVRDVTSQLNGTPSRCLDAPPTSKQTKSSVNEGLEKPKRRSRKVNGIEEDVEMQKTRNEVQELKKQAELDKMKIKKAQLERAAEKRAATQRKLDEGFGVRKKGSNGPNIQSKTPKRRQGRPPKSQNSADVASSTVARSTEPAPITAADDGAEESNRGGEDADPLNEDAEEVTSVYEKKPKFSPIPLENIDVHDLLLMRLHESCSSWDQVQQQYVAAGGREMRTDSLRHRYTQLVATINESLPPEQQVASGGMRVKEPAGNTTEYNAKGYSATGGKVLTQEVWDKVFESFDYSPEPEPEPKGVERPRYQYREPSPVKAADRDYFLYAVVLRTVKVDEDIDACDEGIVTKATSNLGQANEQACKTFQAQQTTRAYDRVELETKDGLSQWKGTLEDEKTVYVRVVRTRHNPRANALPETKEGWVKATCFWIVEHVTQYAPDTEEGSRDGHINFDCVRLKGATLRTARGNTDNVFMAYDEAPDAADIRWKELITQNVDSSTLIKPLTSNHRMVVKETTHIPPKVYTMKDLANCAAVDLVVSQKSILTGQRRIDGIVEERKVMHDKVKELEEDDRALDITFKSMEEAMVVRISVQEASLNGPRNI